MDRHKRDRVLTAEAIQRDPMNAIYLPVPRYARRELLQQISEAAFLISRQKWAEVHSIRAGYCPPADWAGVTEAPDAHEEAEADWQNAEDRFAEVEEKLGAKPAEIEARLGIEPQMLWTIRKRNNGTT